MTNDEFDRTARSWVREGPSALADRVLDAALEEIHVTPQRRPWWQARRSPPMMNSIRIAAVLSVLAIGVAGVSLLRSGTEPATGGPATTVGPSPTSTPAATPTATPRALTGTTSELQPGPHEIGAPFRVRVNFTVPAGWQGELLGPNLAILEKRDGSTGMAFQLFDIVLADPCDFDLGQLDPPVGRGVDDLAAALEDMPTIDVTSPVDVTVGGHDAKTLVLTAPTTIEGCTLDPDGRLRIWEMPLGAEHSLAAGDRTRVWIVDVEGERLVIDTAERLGQRPVDTAEVQEILNSLRLSAAE